MAEPLDLDVARRERNTRDDPAHDDAVDPLMAAMMAVGNEVDLDAPTLAEAMGRYVTRPEDQP